MSWKKNVPMQLTMSRIYLLPFILFLMSFQSFYFSLGASALFIVASVTDFYDGYFARKWNLVTTFGKFMDPVTDKILVLGVLIYMASLKFADPFLVILLTIRDTFIGGVRSAAAADHVVIAAQNSGKWKTGIQMAAIPAMILGSTSIESTKGVIVGASNLEIENFFKYLTNIGASLLWVSSLLSLYSAYQYFLIYNRQRKN